MCASLSPTTAAPLTRRSTSSSWRFARFPPAPGPTFIAAQAKAGPPLSWCFTTCYETPGEVSFEDIVNRQLALLGDYGALGPAPGSDPTGWKAGVAADRTAFMKAFYGYARANPNGSPQLWSDWLKTQR